MKIVKIFLASSSELSPERDMMLDHVTKLNNSFEHRGVTIKLVRWEELEGSVSRIGKQKEYNEELKQCDICLALFWRKYGPNTIEEVDVARNQFLNQLKPEKLYVYFKDVKDDEIEQKLKEFQQNFEGYTNNSFYLHFSNEYDLVVKFFLELELYLSDQVGKNYINVHHGKIYVGEDELVKLNKIPFIIRNEDYQEKQKELDELVEEIADLQKKLDKKQSKLKKRKEKLETNPDDEDYREEYEETMEEVDECNAKLQKKLAKKSEVEKVFEQQQQFIIGVARKITEVRGRNSSKRLKRAIQSFENGDARKADIILGEAVKAADDILADIRAGKKSGLQVLQELILATSVKMANDGIKIDERIKETLIIYEKADAIAKECDYDIKKYIDFLFDYGNFLDKYSFYDDALKAFERVEEMCIQELGEKHSDTARSYNNIGIIYNRKGDYDKAMKYYLKSLAICEKVLSLEHPDTAGSYNNIGNVYVSKGDYDKALEYYRKSLAICEKVLGIEHPDTAASYYNIGIVYDKKGDYNKALEYLIKSSAIREKVFGLEHPDTVSSYNNIGSVYDSKGEYDKALEYYRKSLAIREKVLGMENPDTAISYYNISIVYESKGEYDKALEYMMKANDICEKILGNKNPDTH